MPRWEGWGEVWGGVAAGRGARPAPAPPLVPPRLAPQVQVVDEVFDPAAARRMGIDRVGQVVVMIHSGSRGLGHQVATDALVSMEAAMARDGIAVNDRQLACARIASEEGQAYLAAMACAANYAWVNRSSMTFLARSAFASVFGKPADELDMHVVYDVSHNIAKVEEHVVDGERKTLLVHRKGATRAFPPHHPLVPAAYQLTGQPVLIGGTMGTCSYVLTGTATGMAETFGSTCHGAGRARSRNASRRTLDCETVLGRLKAQGIAIRVASPKLVMEEAPERWGERKGGGMAPPKPRPPTLSPLPSPLQLQGRVRRGGHVPRGRHLPQVRALAPALRREGLRQDEGRRGPGTQLHTHGWAG